jgi:multidrug resistance protein MdtO
MLAQYAVVGMGSLRRHIAWTSDEPIHRMRMSALVSLAGRSTDFAAALSSTVSALSPEERQRAVQLSQRIAGIRRYLNADASAPPRGTGSEGNHKPTSPV